MNDPDWPPPDSSPLIPLEPWGTQLMVFNANQTIPIEQWTGPKGTTPRLPPKLGADRKLVPTETVVCLTDFKRRPKLYLSRADFEALASYLPEIQQQLEYFHDVLKNTPYGDDRAKMQHDMFGRRDYARQRGEYGGPHTAFIVKKGSIRYPKT
eukprot:GHVS01009103.1.p1 GENE.GHVS01009103.1~~GHVS01009103.1.p1  ORF type:complete len:153 (-),score=13.41 GHVS01009103.1:109-567(-)